MERREEVIVRGGVERQGWAEERGGGEEPKGGRDGERRERWGGCEKREGN